jgi:putative protein-disulfide isomerase
VTPVEARYFTDPACPWSWAWEPSLRRLSREFGDGVRITFVLGGLARRFGPPEDLVAEWLDAADRSGMPIDPRLWWEAPPASSFPACLAVKAAAEQGPEVAAPYLRRLRLGLLCARRKLDATEALVEEARAVPGLDVARFRIGLASNAIVEAFGRDLERAEAVDPAHHDPARGRVRLPAIEFAGQDGRVHGVYGWAPPPALSEAARAAGAVPAGGAAPAVEDTLRRDGPLAAPEVAALCDLPGPRAEAELWRLALEWRARPERRLTAVLWSVTE